MGKVYAKIYFDKGKLVPETLEEHTENLLRELERIREIYGEDLKNSGVDEDFWNALKIACLLHDLGKVSSHFQRKIRKYLNETARIPRDLNKEIPHNYLSGIFLYTPEVKRAIPEGYFDYILFSVLFHHNRNLDFSPEYFRKVIELDIKNKIDDLSWLKKYGFSISSVPIDKAGILYKKLQNYYFNSSNKVKNIKRNRICLLYTSPSPRDS
jgi:CRISPR-associated endonuclease/helicase Cas3